MVVRKMSPHLCFVSGPGPCHALRVVKLNKGLDSVCARPPTENIAAPRRRARVSMGLFGLGLPELAVIAGVGIFIFGPSKIAEMGKDLGGLAGGVKKATSEFREAMQESLDEADREIEMKRMEKEEAPQRTIDTSVSAVDNTAEKNEG